MKNKSNYKESRITTRTEWVVNPFIPKLIVGIGHILNKTILSFCGKVLCTSWEVYQIFINIHQNDREGWGWDIITWQCCLDHIPLPESDPCFHACGKSVQMSMSGASFVAFRLICMYWYNMLWLICISCIHPS